MRKEGGYECPYCGFSATIVERTDPGSGNIYRKRRCRLCGLSHTTREVPLALGTEAPEEFLERLSRSTVSDIEGTL